MKVALVVGHRQGSQGAYGSKGISEYKYWSLFAKDLIQRLNSSDYKIFYRQDKKGYTRNMEKLHEAMDKWGADYRVSLHFNASSNPKVDGHEVLYNERDKQSLQLAEMFDKEFDTNMPNRDRSIKPRYKGRGGGFLRRGDGINVLLEPYFASHQHKYTKGTKGYEAIMDSVIAVFAQINNTPAKTKTKSKYSYSKRSLRRLEATGQPLYIKLMKEAIKISEQDITILEDGTFAPYPKDTPQGRHLINKAIMGVTF